MEIELKYRLPDKESADLLWESDYLKRMADPDTRESILMKSVYFDTEDHALRSRDIAFRVRQEGSDTVASLKWGSANGGLHTRQEINVPVADENCLLSPSPDIFRESEDGKALLEILGDRPLLGVLEIHILRRRMRIDYKDCICEVAIDVGGIAADTGDAPICEMEVELFSGSEEQLASLGEELVSRFGLVPEDRPKYIQGLELIGEIPGAK